MLLPLLLLLLAALPEINQRGNVPVRVHVHGRDRWVGG